MLLGIFARTRCKPTEFEPHQRNGEARPQLLLKLRQHRADGDHQDALAAAALDQLAEQHAGLDGLAQAHAVGDQDARAQRLQRQGGRLDLVGCVVDRSLVAQVDFVVGGWGAAQQALQVQASAPILRAVVCDQFGLVGPEFLDLFQLGEEDRLVVAHQFGDPHHAQGGAARVDGQRAPHEPLFITDHDTGAGRKGRSVDHLGRHLQLRPADRFGHMVENHPIVVEAQHRDQIALGIVVPHKVANRADDEGLMLR